MPIETICGGCSKMLRVGDEHAGKRARCPHCGLVYEVPSRSTQNSLDAATPISQDNSWFMQTDDGKSYGPVTFAELQTWLKEGRLTAGCMLRQDDRAPWQSASRTFPELLERASVSPQAPSNAPNPFAEKAENPYASPITTSYPAMPSYAPGMRPHRGGMILTFSIVSWFISCFGAMLCAPFALPGIVFGILAWVMGASDLREMQAGRMDASGEGLTRAGMIIGIVFCVLAGLGAIASVVAMVIGIAMDM